MGVFRFRRFEVRNEKSAMKVNTDGVLLGALMTLLPEDRRLLDIGTGTGTIALMAAQRVDGMCAQRPDGTTATQLDGMDAQRLDGTTATQLDGMPAYRPPGPPLETRPGCQSGCRFEIEREARKETRSECSPESQSGCLSECPLIARPGYAPESRFKCPQESQPEGRPFIIDAIDIDGDSAGEAALNFAGSLWADHLHAHHCPLSGFRPEAPVDLIFSNPPFFTEALHSPSARKARARHADSLPLDEIFGFAARHLAERGRISLILPAGLETETVRTAAVEGLRLFRCISVRASDRKPPYRVIMEFSRDGGREAAAAREMVTINMNGKYSDQYLDIVSDFLLLGKP